MKNLLCMRQWSRFWQLWRVPVSSYAIWYKTWTCYWKGVFAPMFSEWIFPFIIWLAEDTESLKNKFPIFNTFFLLLWLTNKSWKVHSWVWDNFRPLKNAEKWFNLMLQTLFWVIQICVLTFWFGYVENWLDKKTV